MERCYETAAAASRRAILSNGPAGPGPRAPKSQGAPKQLMRYFSSREIIVINCVIFHWLKINNTRITHGPHRLTILTLTLTLTPELTQFAWCKTIFSLKLSLMFVIKPKLHPYLIANSKIVTLTSLVFRYAPSLLGKISSFLTRQISCMMIM